MGTYEATVFFFYSRLPRVDHSKIMILANVPITHAFELNFCVLSVLHVLALSVIHYELLIDVKELRA